MDEQERRINLSENLSSILLNCSEFYAMLLFSVDISFTHKVPTAGVTSTNLLIGIDFWEELTNSERRFVLLHEALHVALMHPFRMREYEDSNKYNKAADYFINLELQNAYSNSMTLSEGVLIDDKYADMSSDEIYKAMPYDKDIENKFEDLLDELKGLSPEKIKILEAEALHNIKTAVDNCKNFGSVPECVINSIKYFDNSEVPWDTRIKQYFKKLIPQRSTFKRPNRRSSYQRKFLLPVVDKIKIAGDIVLYLDVSGSVSYGDLERLYTEMVAIKRSVNPKRMILKPFNTDVLEEIDISKSIPSKIPMGGGTDVNEVMKDIQELSGKVELAIVFSDFYTDDYIKPATSIPILSMVLDNPLYTVPFGVTIHFKG